MGEARIYSVGYEGFSLESLAERLSQNRVTKLVDVRLNPVSRKRGFSKRKLDEGLRLVGIEYVHEPTLGNPPENRAGFGNDDDKAARQVVADLIDDVGQPALRRLADSASSSRVAVLCFERGHLQCHRSVVIDKVLELEPAIEVLHVH